MAIPDRSRLLEMLEGSAPTGAGGLLGEDAAPVGTDAVPTGELAQQAPPPAPMPEGEEGMPGVSPLMDPNMSPEEQEMLKMQLALAARQRLAGSV